MSKKKLELLDSAGIEAGIVTIAKTGKKLDNLIHVVGLSCLAHIEAHGDVRLFNRLFLAMPKGSRKAALTGWALAYGKLRANDGDNKKEQPFVYDKERTTDMAEATKNPWYNFAPDKAPDEVFDVVKALAAIITRAGKAASVNDAALLEKLRAIATGDGDEEGDE